MVVVNDPGANAWRSAAAGSRPFVHVNLAMTSDGRMADACGRALSISCPADWERVHGLRERYDAIAVGGRTWLNDSPRLTARQEFLGHPPLRQPARVIFAGGHPCPIPEDGRPTFVIGRRPPPADRAVYVPARTPDVRGPLQALWRHGVQSLLVEGGPTLLRSFLAAGVVDRLTVFVAGGAASLAQRAPSLHHWLPPQPASPAPLGAGHVLELAPPTAMASAR